MKILSNCPNCGGYLNDTGRCEFCGSKVYDFVNVVLDPFGCPENKTYIRVRSGNRILTIPLLITNVALSVSCTSGRCGTLDYDVVGDVIVEELVDE